MKNRRLGVVSAILIIVILATTLFISGCQSGPEKTTTPATEEVKTLKIGAILWLGMGLGLDSKQGMELSVDLINKSGGLTIGGEKYKIDLIIYDDNGAQATANSALNKLIYEDKAKFIISGSFFEVGMMPTCEKEQVVLIGSSMTDDILNPDLRYCFRGNPGACFSTVLPAWMIEFFPEKKNWVITLYDNQSGHQQASFMEKVLTDLGAQVEFIYIPFGATDMSAMATKVKTINPDVFMSFMGVEPDSLCFKAVYQAGYRGQFFYPGAHSLEAMLMMVPPEVAEGLIKGADPLHLEPSPTQIAADFKKAWIEKYGEWHNPALYYHVNFTCLQAALEAAGSIDVNDVAEVLANGLQWDGPSGSFQMINRPDLGNNRTVDCVEDCYPVQIVNSEVVLLDHIELSESYAIYHKYNQ